jgi:predicted DNA-binding ribbon-helix-helix protein
MPNIISSAAAPAGDESTAEGHKKSRIVKRSIVVAGHKTSISLEDDFWRALKEIAARRNMRLSELVTTIDSGRPHTNLSSAIRLFVLDFFRLELDAMRARRPQRKDHSTSSASGT